jgi:hypothetical protein
MNEYVNNRQRKMEQEQRGKEKNKLWEEGIAYFPFTVY